MAEEILASVQVRRDNKANWEAVNPILLDGEAAYEKDTDMFKIGDGINRYTNLPYHNKIGPQGETGATPQISMNVSTGNPGSSAEVSVSGTAENPVISLTIPRGDVGPTGKTGATGPKGDTGSSGVYIGTSQPTDSNINVWIDSDGEPTEVIDNFAREEIGRLKSEIPTELPNPNALTINGQSYDGSAAVNITITGGDGGANIDDTTPSSTTTYSSQKIESELSALNEAKANNDDLAAVAKSGSYNDLSNKPTIPTVPEALKNPNKLTFTGAVTAEYDGSEAVSVEIPTGGAGSYTLPIASATQLGGVKAVAATDDMTDDVGITAEGLLKVKPGGGSSGGSNWELISTIDFSLEENQNTQEYSYSGKWQEVMFFNDSVQNSELKNDAANSVYCSVIFSEKVDNANNAGYGFTMRKTSNWMFEILTYKVENGRLSVELVSSSNNNSRNAGGEAKKNNWPAMTNAYIKSVDVWLNKFPNSRTLSIYGRKYGV